MEITLMQARVIVRTMNDAGLDFIANDNDEELGELAQQEIDRKRNKQLGRLRKLTESIAQLQKGIADEDHECSDVEGIHRFNC